MTAFLNDLTTVNGSRQIYANYNLEAGLQQMVA